MSQKLGMLFLVVIFSVIVLMAAGCDNGDAEEEAESGALPAEENGTEEELPPTEENGEANDEAEAPAGEEILVPEDYATIQEAIDVASPGDVVVVAPGTYQENINFQGKDIALRSTDPEDTSVVEGTVIDGGGLDTVVTFEGGESQEAILEGFTITNGESDEGGGILILSFTARTSPTVRNNIITGNHAEDHGGGIMVDTSSGLIKANTIENNSTGDTGGGISTGLDASVEIVDNIIQNNSAEWFGGGIRAAGSPSIDNNEIVGNSAPYGGGGISIHDSTDSDPQIGDNEVSGNEPDDIN